METIFEGLIKEYSNYIGGYEQKEFINQMQNLIDDIKSKYPPLLENGQIYDINEDGNKYIEKLNEELYSLTDYIIDEFSSKRKKIDFVAPIYEFIEKHNNDNLVFMKISKLNNNPNYEARNLRTFITYNDKYIFSNINFVRSICA